MANTAWCKSAMLENFSEKIYDCGGLPRKKRAKGASFLICSACWRASEQQGLDIRCEKIFTDLNYDAKVLDLASALDEGQAATEPQLRRLLSQKWDGNFELTKPKEDVDDNHDSDDEGSYAHFRSKVPTVAFLAEISKRCTR